MTSPAPAVVQVVGRPRAADPVTATARGWHARLDRLGAGGDVVDPAAAQDGTRRARLLLHSVDGGEDLAPLLPRLDGRRLTLVHHGSAPGSDRRALRALRPHTERALAADAGAREELRGLGFRRVEVLDPGLADLDGTVSDEATVAALARHPGPRLLHIGPLGPRLGIETLLDAMAELLTHHVPDAVLTLCGPAPLWYRQQLHRTITRQGLLACEVVAPTTDAEVVARLDASACLLALRPVGLDPYVRAAIARGVPVVGPRSPHLVGVPDAALVELPSRPDAAAMTTALRDGLARSRRPGQRPAPPGPDHDARLQRALGLP